MIISNTLFTWYWSVLHINRCFLLSKLANTHISSNTFSDTMTNLQCTLQNSRHLHTASYAFIYAIVLLWSTMYRSLLSLHTIVALRSHCSQTIWSPFSWLIQKQTYTSLIYYFNFVLSRYHLHANAIGPCTMFKPTDNTSLQTTFPLQPTSTSTWRHISLCQCNRRTPGQERQKIDSGILCSQTCSIIHAYFSFYTNLLIPILFLNMVCS